LDGRATVEDEVEFGNRRFKLFGVIGRGAFGVVRKAIESTSSRTEGLQHVARPAAVKFMTTKTAQAFETAIFEAELLRLLTEGLGATSNSRVPQYFGHDAARDGPGGLVRLAMSYIPGVVLDQWVYGISDAQHKRVDVGQLVSGRLPGGRQRSMGLTAACDFARALLAQLASVMVVLEPIAYHRDISSHNVLVDTSGDPHDRATGSPSFALIDFGLAVGSGTWPDEWNNSNLAGDPRYWTPAAWMAFAFGFHFVEGHENQGHVRQYLHRIDHYSVGVLGLEILFALWDEGSYSLEGSAPGLMEVREAWCAFWEAAVRLFQMFHVQGPLATREHLTSMQESGMAFMTRLLARVRETLRSAAAETANLTQSGLLRTLADLIDEQGTGQWESIVGLVNTKVPKPPTAQSATCGGQGVRAESGGHRRMPSMKEVNEALVTSRNNLAASGVPRLRGGSSPGQSAVRMRSCSPPCPQLASMALPVNAASSPRLLPAGLAQVSHSYTPPPLATSSECARACVPLQQSSSWVPPPVNSHHAVAVPSSPQGTGHSLRRSRPSMGMSPIVPTLAPRARIMLPAAALCAQPKVARLPCAASVVPVSPMGSRLARP